MIRVLALLLIFAGAGFADTVRIVAANLTSGNRQSYSLDNGNHSNPEGAGARILKGLQPDIVLIQEFNTSVPTRQWVNATLGQEYSFAREESAQIPNGIISRFRILESGEWDDPVQENRDFVWARLALPDGSRLLVVSVHFSAKNEKMRAEEAVALVGFLKENAKPDERVLVGGDLNVRNLSEQALQELSAVVEVPGILPSDGVGNFCTNGPRNRPYDWVLVDPVTQRLCSPVKIADLEFPSGLVFDTRIFTPLEAVPPVQAGDSAVPQMQHMAVVRDFLLTP